MPRPIDATVIAEAEAKTIAAGLDLRPPGYYEVVTKIADGTGPVGDLADDQDVLLVVNHEVR